MRWTNIMKCYIKRLFFFLMGRKRFSNNPIFGLMSKKDWFASWFDTSYYHVLYKSRDHAEARKFITRLVENQHIPSGANVLDLACGKGRHSLTLAELGMQVLGVDLSAASIEAARKNECEHLKFLVHDMREVVPKAHFNYIFNLFTSFGYFDDESDNEKVLQCVHTMLHPEGKFIFDYLNLNYTLRHLVAAETKEIEGIRFDLHRSFDGKHILKKIDVLDQDQKMQFEEKVRGFRIEEMEEMLIRQGFTIENSFGNFELAPYDKENSERMILICKKK